jgi:ABC-type antimicrobial peptide transport system permease subunit
MRLQDSRRITSTTNRYFAKLPESSGCVGDTLEVLNVERPAEIVNYRTMGSTPLLLGALLALAALAALAVTLVASVRRRRRDLAIFKTLGFKRRQLSSTVAWQASVTMIIGVVVGIPIGIVLGRLLWTLFARAIYVVPEPSVPWLTLVLVALGAMVFVNIVASIPGRIAASTPTALVLRSE